jgi:YfiH family protein
VIDGWIPADWPAPDDVIAGTTTRVGGVSTGVYESLNLGAHVGDDPEAVAENRARFVAVCGLPGEPEWLTQVHGTAVRVTAETDAVEANTAEADAAITQDRSTVVAVLTADCLPILLCAENGAEVAAVHGGWRGLAAGVIATTVSRMVTKPGRLLAWLGPAISQAAFEVGDEVRQAFVGQAAAAAACFEPNEGGRWQADLYALARLQLHGAGVGAVYGGNLCTYSDSGRFFSYRRDGGCGRMASFICRKR